MPEGGQPDTRSVTAALSGTPIADEYRRIDSALRQCEPIAHPFDPTNYPPQVIEKARRWWLGMMRTEYESATGFIDLATQVREIAAPFDVQTVLLRMAQDELRHAAICAQVIEGLGGEATIAALPLQRSMLHPDCTPEESVLRTIIYGCCLGETVNAARLMKQVGEVREPFVREAFRLLLADERLHAQFGFHYLESRRAWLEARPAITRSLGRYLHYGFASLEQYMGVVPADARPPTEPERQIGLPDLTELSATFQETILNASVPGLERFGIDAMAAWRGRTMNRSAPPKI